MDDLIASGLFKNHNKKSGRTMKLIIIFLILPLVFGCTVVDSLVPHDTSRGRYIRQSAEINEALNKTEDEIIALLDEGKEISKECDLIKKNLDCQVKEYEATNQSFIKSLSDKQLQLYSNLVETKKRNNLPQAELSERRFLKSLTNKNIQDLKILSQQEIEIKHSSDQYEAYKHSLSVVKNKIEGLLKQEQELLYLHAELSKEYYDYRDMERSMRLSSMNHFKDWHTATQQNLYLNQINQNLGDIARSLRGM